MDCITHGHEPHHAWTAHHMGVASARTNYAISKYFVKRFFSTIIQKLDVLCPGRFVTHTFCNLDIL
jgi:hypothetical protein